jgi:malate dehydrogenase
MKVAEMMNGGEVVLLDIKEGVAEGKAMDISQALAVTGKVTYVTGVTNDYSATENSDIVVITSGVPRKPGMTREELVGVNKGVVESVMDNLLKYQGKNTIYIVVSNPMDTMTQLVVNYLGVENAHRVIGMGGLLDSARFKYNIFMKLQEKHPNTFTPDEIYAKVIGGHGDTTMVPLTNTATVFGNPLKSYFTDEEIADIVDKTMRGGAILTKALGTSAWEAPAMGIYDTVNKLLGDEGYDLEMFPASVYRKEYGLCIGSIINVNYDGVTEIFLDETTDPIINEKFLKSVEAVRAVNEAL